MYIRVEILSFRSSIQSTYTLCVSRDGERGGCLPATEAKCSVLGKGCEQVINVISILYNAGVYCFHIFYLLGFVKARTFIIINSLCAHIFNITYIYSYIECAFYFIFVCVFCGRQAYEFEYVFEYTAVKLYT